MGGKQKSELWFQIRGIMAKKVVFLKKKDTLKRSKTKSSQFDLKLSTATQLRWRTLKTEAKENNVSRQLKQQVLIEVILEVYRTRALF